MNDEFRSLIPPPTALSRRTYYGRYEKIEAVRSSLRSQTREHWFCSSTRLVVNHSLPLIRLSWGRYVTRARAVVRRVSAVPPAPSRGQQAYPYVPKVFPSDLQWPTVLTGCFFLKRAFFYWAKCATVTLGADKDAPISSTK